MQGTVPGTTTCPHAAPLPRLADPVHTPSQEHTYQTVECARIPEEPGAGAHWARGNPRSTWRNKRWGGRLSGSPRQLVEMCLLISSCCSTSRLRSWDLFSEHFGIRQTRLPPASQLNPFAIWLMIKRVMVYTERAVKDAVCEQDRQVSKPEQQTVQSAEPQIGSAKSPGFQIQCPLQRELKSVCAPCLALSLSHG